jgi:serine/threonine-protein kinase
VTADTFDGKYDVVRELGRGGMGRVLLARHRALDREVAIKVIHPHWTHDREAMLRLVREARIAASLASKHIACVYDLGRTADGRPYIVMERLVGVELATRIKEGPVAIADAVDWGLQILAALKEAHSHGVVHRDVKPRNVFLVTEADGRERIKVVDFGLAKCLPSAPSFDPGSQLTGASRMLGSPSFMSPEQIRDATSVDERSDIWSFGATLYQILTGRPPFRSSNPHVTCSMVLSNDSPPMSTYRDGIPPELEAIVRRCLSRDRSRRYASAAELETALLALRHRPAGPGAPSAPEAPASADPITVVRPRVVDAAATIVRPLTPPQAAPPCAAPSRARTDPAPRRAEGWARALRRRGLAVALAAMAIMPLLAAGIIVAARPDADVTASSALPRGSSTAVIEKGGRAVAGALASEESSR